jgi:hypothetical protein
VKLAVFQQRVRSGGSFPFLREVAWSLVSSLSSRKCLCWIHPPTLELASVKLFNVVLLPLDGLPTNPINGSRGIANLADFLWYTDVHGRSSSGVDAIRNECKYIFCYAKPIALRL